MADRVTLTDLDVITRYSIAVRSATADRDELVETLRADLAWLEGRRDARPVAAEPAAPTQGKAAPRRAATRTATVPKKAAADKTAAKRSAAKKAAANKAAPRRSSR